MKTFEDLLLKLNRRAMLSGVTLLLKARHWRRVVSRRHEAAATASAAPSGTAWRPQQILVAFGECNPCSTFVAIPAVWHLMGNIARLKYGNAQNVNSSLLNSEDGYRESLLKRMRKTFKARG